MKFLIIIKTEEKGHILTNGEQISFEKHILFDVIVDILFYGRKGP